MKTIIDNTERVFLVNSPDIEPRYIFANLEDLPRVLKHTKIVEVSHFWNGRLQIVSKNELNGMFAANQIDFQL